MEKCSDGPLNIQGHPDHLSAARSSSALAKTGYRFAAAPNDVAGAIARAAFSHYIFPDADPASALHQLRAAAGLAKR